MHVNLFAYGTIRTHPARAEIDGLNVHGWDATADIIGTLGQWELRDRRMFSDGNVPAVSGWTVDGAKVIGDVYRLSLDGFRRILAYEGFPRLYDYEVLTVRDRLTGDSLDAVVFTTTHADMFGPASNSGDYFTKEGQCDLTSRS